MAIGDALANALMKQRSFMPHDFARYHPGGPLGRRLLTRVADVMHKVVPIVAQDGTFITVIQKMTCGCQGMVAVTDGENHLVGIITDGDLRRFMKVESTLNRVVAVHIMTRVPLTVSQKMKIDDAEEMMQKHRVSLLLVTD